MYKRKNNTQFVTYTIETTHIDWVDSIYIKTNLVSKIYEYVDVYI